MPSCPRGHTEKEFIVSLMHAAVEPGSRFHPPFPPSVSGNESQPAMKEERLAGFRALHLFPGVELSVQGGVHILALFDPSVPLPNGESGGFVLSNGLLSTTQTQ